MNHSQKRKRGNNVYPKPNVKTEEKFTCSTISRLADMFKNSEMCDVCLVIDGKEYPCHRLILSVSSEVFKIMLNTKSWTEASSDRIILYETRDCASVFTLFLRYLYTGRIYFSLSNVMPFYVLADKYAIADLLERCQIFMKNQLAPAAKSGYLLRWISCSVIACNNDLITHLFNFLLKNVSLLTTYQGISQLNEETLLTLLRSSDVVIEDEMSIYRLAALWLHKQGRCHTRLGMVLLLERVISSIRFGMLTPDQSVELLICPLARKHPKLFMNRMAVNLLFHRGDSKALEGFLGTRQIVRGQFCPRLYTSNSTSSLITVDDIRNLRNYHVTTYLFSTDIRLAGHERDRNCEWIVDIHPKGVRMLGCYLITYHGKLELPGSTVPDTRLTVTCKNPAPSMPFIKITILIYGEQGGVEYVQDSTHRYHQFDNDNRVVHFHKFIPHKLDKVYNNVPYLVGDKNNTLKLRVIIVPLPSHPHSAW